MLKILQSQLEYKCPKTITEGFRDYSALWQHIYERPMTGSTILYTFARGPLDLEALGFSLPSL